MLGRMVSLGGDADLLSACVVLKLLCAGRGDSTTSDACDRDGADDRDTRIGRRLQLARSAALLVVSGRAIVGDAAASEVPAAHVPRTDAVGHPSGFGGWFSSLTRGFRLPAALLMLVAAVGSPRMTNGDGLSSRATVPAASRVRVGLTSILRKTPRMGHRIGMSGVGPSQTSPTMAPTVCAPKAGRSVYISNSTQARDHVSNGRPIAPNTSACHASGGM